MLTADIAQVILTNAEDNIAKPLFVKMRATVAAAQLEMGIALVGDTVLDDQAVAVRKSLVFFERVGVNIYFPTDAAAVSAFVGNAMKILVVFWSVKSHNFAFRNFGGFIIA